MVRLLFICFCLTFVLSKPILAQDANGERTDVDDLLECSVFYETLAALKARDNKAPGDLWEKADVFKRKGIEKAELAKTLSMQEINTRNNYLVKKWAKRILSDSRLGHQQGQDIRLWTRFCDELGDEENILPLKN